MNSKGDLLAIVADLRAMGYGASDIAMAVQRSPERIRQILRDLHLTRPRLSTINDLPHDMRERVLAFRCLQNGSEMQTVSCETS